MESIGQSGDPVGPVPLNFRDPKFEIFPYKMPKTPKYDPTLTSYISATAWSWVKSEPILETRYVEL